jgi:hypothetical protein
MFDELATFSKVKKTCLLGIVAGVYWKKQQ